MDPGAARPAIMTPIHKVVKLLKRHPRLYAALILPFYFLRFIWVSVRERSLWFYRYPPGHYGSTLPSLREITRRRAELYSGGNPGADGIELNTSRQLELLQAFSGIGAGIRFNARPSPGQRYYADNQTYRLSDAIILACFLRHLRTRNVVEVGSGFSSALMLDLQEPDQPRNLTFIDPVPGNLKRLIRPEDARHCRIVERRVQEVPPAEFDVLQAGDVLFIDSSHVMKIGSDLSALYFTVLPRLKAGVVVHVHDIAWPFEYRETKLRQGRAWNEIYVVRTFLQYNDTFEILYFASYIEQAHRPRLQQCLPGYTEFTGTSLWLRKRKPQSGTGPAR